MAWLSFIGFLAVVWAAGYCRLNRYAWLALMLVALLLLSCLDLPGVLLLVCWLFYLSIAALISLSQWRRRFLMRPLFQFFKRQLPPMGQTEREALEAGDTWWEGNLFRGAPDWQQLQTQPGPRLSASEQQFLDHETEQLCQMLNDWDIVQHHHDLPAAAWDFLKRHRFFGLIIAPEYGGLGFSAAAHSAIVTKIATRSLSAAVNMMVPNSLGPAELLMHYGTPEQKKHYLPRLACGEEIPCFCLTGPDAGSDASAITDTGVICRGEVNGKATLGIRLNWNKHYISLAPVATVLGLAFHLYDPDRLLSDVIDRGITLCLIPTDTPGVRCGRRHWPMNLAFMNGPVQGEDVFVPLDWIIGGAEQIGHGWAMLMDCLAVGRSISLPAMSSACAQLAYRMTGAYARVRRQFNQPIGHFEGVEASLALIGGFSYLMESMRQFLLTAVEQGHKPAIASAIGKYHMTEMGRHIINAAMDIHGGRAIQNGPRNYLAHAYMAIPISITVEGANILTRNLIIFGQGAVRCHPYLRQEMACAEQTDEQAGLLEFDQTLVAHLGYAHQQALRTLFMGLTRGRLIRVPRAGDQAVYYRQITRLSTALAWVSDVALMVLGGQLKRRESLSARLGDVLSYLFMASSVLHYAQQQQPDAAEKNHAEWALQWCLYQAQEAFYGFFENFPKRAMGKFLKWQVFPMGRCYALPTDQLSHAVANSMLQPSPLRDRLSQYCYLSGRAEDSITRVEVAFRAAIAAEKVEKKLLRALRDGQISSAGNWLQRVQSAEDAGILTEQEANQLRLSEQARYDAIIVDDFAATAFKETFRHGN